jgi:DNA polymerase III alpha subunit
MLANLHIHTEYSMLESAIRINDLIKAALQYDWPACAITDTDNTYGVIKFYQQAQKKGVRPIIGSLITQNDSYLILLAKNNFGYFEINRLISCKNLKHDDFDLFSFINTRVRNCFILSPYAHMIRRIREYCSSSVFFELPLTWPEKSKEKIIRDSLEMKVAFVPTWPAYFLFPEDHEIYKLLVSIKNNRTIYSSEEECADKKDNYFISLREFSGLLKKYPGSKERIERITEQCNVEFTFDKIELPGMRFSRRRSPFKKLLHLCMRSLNRRKPHLDRSYIERLRKETTVIKKMNLESYFLIVYSIVCFAREQNISYTGRGSAANSLVCFLLDFTFVDPLEYDLYFERFLHLKRIGLPDVDLDFPWNRRDEVIQFIYDKFRFSHTALICTHITFNVRSAIRETAKAFGLDDRQISRMTKKIPFFFRIESLTEITEKLPEFKTESFSDSLWEKILY